MEEKQSEEMAEAALNAEVKRFRDTGGKLYGKAAENAENVASGERPEKKGKRFCVSCARELEPSARGLPYCKRCGGTQNTAVDPRTAEICPLCKGGPLNGHVAGCARLAEELPLRLGVGGVPLEELVRQPAERPSRTFHLRIDLAGALSHWNAREWTECVRDDDGIMLTPARVREKFQEMLAAGTKFIPIGSCEDFDPEHGCRGHRSPAAAIDLPPVTVEAKKTYSTPELTSPSRVFRITESQRMALCSVESRERLRSAFLDSDELLKEFDKMSPVESPAPAIDLPPVTVEPLKPHYHYANGRVSSTSLMEFDSPCYCEATPKSDDPWEKYHGRLVTCDRDRTPHIFNEACEGVIHLSEQKKPYSKPELTGPFSPGELEIVKAEAARLTALINTPEIIDFVKAVQIEAVHQRERWGSKQDEGKTAADWFWLLGYLAGKAIGADKVGDREKLLHHIITTSAACANWHAQVLGECNVRPGIETPPGEK